MKNKKGYLVANTKNPTDVMVYTYKKGVMEATGATRNQIDTLKDWLIVNGWVIREIDIRGFSRDRNR